MTLTQVLVIQVRDRRCVLPLVVVVEVAPMVHIVPLPTVSAPIVGYIRFRGSLVPVVDLAQRLGLPTTPVTPDGHLIIVRLAERLVALWVDRVLELDDCEAHPLPIEASAAPVSGVIALDDHSWFVLDLAELLSLEARRTLEDVLAALSGTSVAVS